MIADVIFLFIVAVASSFVNWEKLMNSNTETNPEF